MTRRISVRRSFARAGAQVYEGTCSVCGAPFLTGREATLYCSEACCQKAHRRRQPLALPATPQPAEGYETREWQGTPIQRRASDGWVNATAMCQAGGKRWNDYIRLDRTREYIAALQQSLAAETPCAAAVAGNPATLPSVIEVRQGGDPRLQGTWIHPRLAVDLARWISPAFAVWMDGWFLEIVEHVQQGSAPTPTPSAPPEDRLEIERYNDRITIRAATFDDAERIWQRAVLQYLQLELTPGRSWQAHLRSWRWLQDYS